MPKVVMLLADGFEEIEAMAVVDILRRAGVDITLAGLHEGPITSARKVRVLPDTVIDSVRADDYDMVVLPGGQPGADNLNADQRVRALLQSFARGGKLTGAICAAPYVLANAGVLDGKRATAYPTFRERLAGASYEERSVVQDGNVVTSQGPGTAIAFGLAIAARLAGEETANKVREAMLVRVEWL